MESAGTQEVRICLNCKERRVSPNVMSAVETKDWGRNDTGREIIFLEEAIAMQGLG